MPFYCVQVHHDGRKTDPDCIPRYVRSVTKVATTITGGTFDYLSVCELIYQSNRNLDPAGVVKKLPELKLTWSQQHGQDLDSVKLTSNTGTTED